MTLLKVKDHCSLLYDPIMGLELCSGIFCNTFVTFVFFKNECT